MKTIKRPDGSLNVRATILSLEVGEVWTTKEIIVNAEYVRGVASKLGRATGNRYTVSNSKADKGRVVIQRTM